MYDHDMVFIFKKYQVRKILSVLPTKCVRLRVDDVYELIPAQLLLNPSF